MTQVNKWVNCVQLKHLVQVYFMAYMCWIIIPKELLCNTDSDKTHYTSSLLSSWVIRVKRKIERLGAGKPCDISGYNDWY